MQIYNNKNWKLELINEIWFMLEKDMQTLTEKNLDNIFWLEFIKTEFQLNNLRVDTLAFDNENNYFVIIEYKRWNSYSVVDQWMSYLSLLLNNRADFLQELAKKRNKYIDVNDIEWWQSKVIIIADSFNRYQKDSINFKDLPIELYELKNFNNNTVLYNQINASNPRESIKTITKFQTKEFENVNKEIKTYISDDHFKEGWDISRELYEEIREKILALDSRIEESPVKLYIWYKIWNKVAVLLYIQKSKIILELLRVQPNDLNDPDNKTQYQENSMKFYNKHVSTYNINNRDDIDYWIMLVKQILKKFF